MTLIERRIAKQYLRAAESKAGSSPVSELRARWAECREECRRAAASIASLERALDACDRFMKRANAAETGGE